VADQLQAFELPETVVAVIDLALWDLAGRVTGLPVHTLLAGARDRVKAYASSWHNLGLPEDYATHAACQHRGYGAYKIHSHYYWDPATKQFALGRPSRVEWDIERCRVVRAAVGDELALSYDPWGPITPAPVRFASVASSNGSVSTRTSTRCPSTASSPTSSSPMSARPR